MILKLECQDEVAAMYIAHEWPESTYKRGNAVLLCHMPPNDVAHIQAMTGAYTGEVTDDDCRVLAEKFGEACLQD